MGLLERINARHAGRQPQPASRKQFTQPPFWQVDGLRSALLGYSAPDQERIEHDFEAYAGLAGKGSGVVFACHYARLRVFSAANFQWCDRVDGQLGTFYDSTELGMLRRPWPGGTLQNLLAWMEVDATYAGNGYETTCDDRGRYGNASRGGPGRRIVRLRPDWVTLVIGSHSDDPYALDAHVVGLIYEPPLSSVGHTSRAKPVVLLPSEVAHYAPIPDPVARFRGMSWLTPVLREISSDKAAVEHKLKRFEQGATLQTVVSLDKDVSPEAFDEFVSKFRAGHEGAANAYKTLFLGGGADVTVVGADMQKLDFKALTGAGETRIAAAAGVHPVVVGLSESLAGSSLNAGNYSAARRNVADGTLSHLWKEAAASLEILFERPKPTAELCVDKRDVAFVRDDAKDVAEIKAKDAQTIRTLTDAGFTAESIQNAVISGDWSMLEHSGLFSVQLQPPGAATPEETAPDDETPPDEANPEPPAQQDGKAADASRSRKRYNPLQPRDGHGRFGEGSVSSAADPLKLASRIRLDAGESFGGSAKVNDVFGDVTAVMARVDGPAGMRIRFGLVHPEDARKWRAEDKGGTVELDKTAAGELRNVLKNAVDAGRRSVNELRAEMRERHAEGASVNNMPNPEVTIDSGKIRGTRWGDLNWRLEREEGDDFEVRGEVIGSGGKWSLQLTADAPSAGSQQFDPFSLESTAQINKVDKALASLIAAADER